MKKIKTNGWNGARGKLSRSYCNSSTIEYVEISDILEVAKERNEDPFVIVLDGIEDPHNLGSIIRTAETAGVHGVIIPKRRAVSVNSTVNKASAGAVEHMKIARVTNISDAIEELKKLDYGFAGQQLIQTNIIIIKI